MIIKVSLYIKNEDWKKLVKSMAMIKTYNSTECSNESFENVTLI